MEIHNEDTIANMYPLSIRASSFIEETLKVINSQVVPDTLIVGM